MALTAEDVAGWRKDKATGWLIEPRTKRLVNPYRLEDYDFSDQEESK